MKYLHDCGGIWEPAELERGAYLCSGCGASGWRPMSGPNKGRIVPHKKKREAPKSSARIVGRPVVAEDRFGAKTPAFGGYRTPRRPGSK